MFEKTKSFLMKCRRVWQVLKKPTKMEFQQTTKVSAIGIAIIGLIGFIVALIMTVFS
jgi:protein transport protein SEC61 subunit gamma-like protein